MAAVDFVVGHHPEALAPELIESTAAWTTVVTAIAQDLQDATALLQGQPVPVCFADRCDAESELRRQLEQLCTQQLHGLLMKWLIISVQERLAVHAVPQFWQHYRELAGGHYPLVGVAQQRRCLASAFTAIARLYAYMSAQLRLVRLLDLKSWRPHSGGENARGSRTSACSCSSGDLASGGGGGGRSGGGGSGDGSPMIGGEPVDEAGEPGESPAAAELLTVLGALLQGAAPDTQAFATWMTNCWERAFLDTTRAERSAAWAWQEGDAEADGEAESIQVVADEEDEEGAPAVPELRRQMRAFCAQLCALRWLPLVEPSLSITLHTQLRQMLTARCARSFESRQLSRLLGWLGSVAMPWLRLVLHPEAAEGAADSAALQHWHARLRFATMQSLASLRIGELFDLVVDWPDSLPALDDLTECLRHTREHSRLVAQLRAQVSQRLLKPGADTSNIIQVYVCTIRALRHVDPSGVLLEAISEPMRAYLKARSDTVRQIVTSLTDPESSELLESGDIDGGGGEFLQDDHGIDDDALDLDEIKGDEKAMLQWKPDPVAADPTRSSYSRRSSDVLACLVNIYGSKTLFVNEFRAMLADKLLSAVYQPGGSPHDTDREVRHLELLKKRFGEAALQHCEVMLRDVGESRRITTGIHKHFGDTDIQVVDVTVVSRTCWPLLPAEVFQLPTKVQQQLDRYEKQFLHAKAPRKLAWKPALGCVTLDVHFDDGSVVRDVTCTPLHATILHHFGERRRWPLKELAEALGVSRDLTKRKLRLWLNRGFLHEVPPDGKDGDTTYTAASSLGNGDAPRHVTEEDDDGDGADAKAKQLEDEMKVYEQYVVGMLTNLESLPLDRIHNMLKMFVQSDDGNGGYDRTEQELQRFLGRMVEDGKLEAAGGQYRIRATA